MRPPDRNICKTTHVFPPIYIFLLTKPNGSEQHKPPQEAGLKKKGSLSQSYRHHLSLKCNVVNIARSVSLTTRHEIALSARSLLNAKMRLANTRDHGRDRMFVGAYRMLLYARFFSSNTRGHHHH